MVKLVKCRLDLYGKWKEPTPEFCEMVEYEKEELAKLSLTDLIHGNDQGKINDVFSGTGKVNSKEWEADINLISKNGHSIPVYLTLTPISNGEGRTIEFLCHICNLSNKKDLHQKWQTSKQQFESLFHHNPLPVYYYDLEGNFRDVNEKLAEFTGLSRDELIGMHFENFITGEDLERAKEQFKSATEGKAGQYEIEVVVKGGIKKDIRVTKFPMYLGDEITGVYGIFEDITNQKRIEQNLQESEQLFRSLFSHNPYPVMRFDLEGNFMEANNKTIEMAGYSREELLESGFSSFIAEEDLEEIGQKFAQAASGEPQYYEVKGHTKNDVLDIQATLSPIYVNGEIKGLFCIAKDITQQKKAEQKLKESEQRWQQLVEYNPQPVLIIQDGKIVFINKVGADYFKASSAKEMIGIPMNSFSDVDSWEEANKRMHQLEQNEQVAPHEYKIVLSDGEKRHVETHSIPITYKGKAAIQTVIHDISDLKEKQHLIGKSLKEKEILLQEIHHRVKNNLAVISGLLELQRMSITDEDTVQALKESQMRIQSMAMIHEKLYQSESLHDIGFDSYLKELISTINSTYSTTHEKVSTEFDLTEVTLDLDQAIPCSLIVNEVIVNCYKHAFDKNDEGKISIRLDCTDSKITLEITDSGKGLPSDFDITKQQSLGTTLIDALSRQINGEMVLKNRTQGTGTKFKLHFSKKAV